MLASIFHKIKCNFIIVCNLLIPTSGLLSLIWVMVFIDILVGEEFTEVDIKNAVDARLLGISGVVKPR